MVLDYVGLRAGGAPDGAVPADAVVAGLEDHTAWWGDFTDAVHRDATARGLARPRWSGPARLALVAASVVVGAAVAVAVVSLSIEPEASAAARHGDADEDLGGLIGLGTYGGVGAFCGFMLLAERKRPVTPSRTGGSFGGS
jgi:hypothetical protein